MSNIENNIDADEMPRTEYIEEDKMSAVKRVLRKSADALNDPRFINKVADEWMKKKLEDFPKLCAEAQRVNILKKKQLTEMGNAAGWSDTKDFKFDYTIPRELYSFMVNMVSREFWSEENEKVWRPFLDGIVKGDDGNFLLYKCKQYFDGNDQSNKLIVKG